jgi:hypothetical protein
MSKISIEIDASYQAKLDFIKEMFPDAEGNKVNDNGEIIEELIESFITFIQQQTWESHGEEGHVHGEGCNH